MSDSNSSCFYFNLFLLSEKADNSCSHHLTNTKLLHKLQDHLFFKKKQNTKDALYQIFKNYFLRNVSKSSVYLGPIWSQLNLAAHGLLLGVITVWRRVQFVQHSTDLEADLVLGQIHRLC